MKQITRASMTKRECSEEKAFHLVMPELWFRKIIPRVFLDKESLNEINEDSPDIFQRNMLDLYIMFYKEVNLNIRKHFVF